MGIALACRLSNRSACQKSGGGVIEFTFPLIAVRRDLPLVFARDLKAASEQWHRHADSSRPKAPRSQPFLREVLVTGLPPLCFPRCGREDRAIG